MPARPLVIGSEGWVRSSANGLPYLWAGRSGFGFDSSGLTSLDLRAHGVVIPRDADAQAVQGKAVSRIGLRPGDLLFYATRGNVHHVSVFAGNGRMVQSPRTGSAVQTIAVSTTSYAREYAGACALSDDDPGWMTPVG